jgi:hypothetical protein
MKKKVLLLIGILSFLLETKESIAQQMALKKEYPLELVLRNDSTIHKGIILHARDTSLTFLPISYLKKKYPLDQFIALLRTEINVPYSNISYINTLQTKRNSPNKIFQDVGRGMVIGTVIGLIGGLLASSPRNTGFAVLGSGNHKNRNDIDRTGSLVVGGFIGLGIGTALGIVVGLSKKEKVYEKIEFVPDANSIESQRTMVSKLIYK